MKKLLPIVLLLTFVTPLILWLMSCLGVQFLGLGRLVVEAVGVSMIIVGIFGMLKSSFSRNDKEEVYQGAFCALIGYSISDQSIIAFIAAVVLVAWVDYRGLSLLRSSR